MTEKNAMLGPGTDLVISLFSIALILIGIVSGLYLESVNTQVKEASRIEEIQNLDLSFEEKIERYKREAIKLTTQLKLLNEENKRLMTQHHTLGNDYKKLILELHKTQAKLNKALFDSHDMKKKLAISKITVKELSKGHDNTDIPKRDSTDKQIYRVYIEIRKNKYSFFYKPPGRENRFQLERTTIHKKLSQAKDKYGADVYVSVIMPDNFSVGKAKQLRCEFWKYDYYEYFEKTYCR